MIDFILSLINSFLYDATTGAYTNWLERWKKKRFEKKLRAEVELFCKINESTYFDSGDFEVFLRYHKPLELIMQNTIAGENTVDVEELIDTLVNEADQSAKDLARILSVDDKRMVNDLCVLIESRIRQYYSQVLTEQQKYIVSCNVKNTQELCHRIDKAVQGQNENVESIKALIIESSQLSDYKSEPIAQLISKKMWEGDFDEVEKLRPIIEEKSKDLSCMAKIIELVFFKNSDDTELLEYHFSQISNPDIRNCAIRSILPVIFFRNHNVRWLANYAVGKKLKNIISAIAEEDFSFIFTEEIGEVDRLETHNFVVNKQLLCDEPFLSRMIVVVYLYKMKLVNTAELMEDFRGETDSWLTNLLTADKKVDVLQYNSYEDNNKHLINEIEKSFIKKNPIYSRLATDIQIIFYALLLKASLCVREDIGDLEQMIPSNLLHEKMIEDFIIGSKIKSDDITLDEIYDYCKRIGEYWILVNFIVKSGKSERALEIIESHIDLIDLVPNIFFIYIEGLNYTGKTEVAKNLLNQYKDKYGVFFEYWNLYLSLHDSDDAKMIFIAKCKEEKLVFLIRYEEYLVIERLISLGENDLASEYIHRVEMQIGENSRIRKYKGLILQSRNKNIDALEVFKSIFDEYSKDSQVINAIITLSINMKRSIDSKYIDAANALKTTRMYLLAAAAYAASGNIVDARRNNIRAILASDDYRNPAFMQYLGINLRESDKGKKDYSIVEKDSAVHIKNVNGHLKVYCIYDDKLLPCNPFIWNGDTHIYVEDAAQMGIYKQPIGEKIIIDGEQYTIENVESLDTYFAHNCFKNIVENGSAQAITSPVTEGKMDVNSFVEQFKAITGDDRERIDWIKQYSDFQDVALPLFSIYKFYNASYTQFVEIIYRDPQVCIRETLISGEIKSDKFILSFASLMMLKMIGVSTDFINHSNAYISESTKIQVNNDIAKMIDRYSQEHVMSMGIYDGRPYTIQVEDGEKKMWMKEGGELKQYVDRIGTVLNINDLSGELFEQVDVSELFGIPDYDVIAISLYQGYSIVSIEAMLSSLKSTEEVKLDAISITDWMIYCKMSWRELIPIIHKMIELGSLTAFNVNFVEFLLNQYEICGDDEKEEMLVLLQNLLEQYNSMHKNYKRQAIQELTRTYATIINQKDGLEQNELMRLYTRHLMILQNIRMSMNILEDGSFEIVAYQLDESITEEKQD